MSNPKNAELRVYDSMGNIVEESILHGHPVCGNGILEPGEECDPPDGLACAGNCFLDYGDCCAERTEPGCSNPTMEQCVCALDDWCCTVAWDFRCVEEVVTFGCGQCESDPVSGGGITTTAIYDGVGNLRQCTYPGGRMVTYVYDSNNRLDKIKDASVPVDELIDYGYCGPSRIEGSFSSNNIRSTIGYDEVRRVSATDHEGLFGATFDVATVQAIATLSRPA